MIGVLSLDESPLGLMVLKGRRLSLRGVKPLGEEHTVFENYYVYGAVEPKRMGITGGIATYGVFSTGALERLTKVQNEQRH